MTAEFTKNKELLAKFMGWNSFDQTSWNDLMLAAEKLSKIWSDDYTVINGEVFKFQHMMFHEIIGNRDHLYDHCVKLVKLYYKHIAPKEA